MNISSRSFRHVFRFGSRNFAEKSITPVKLTYTSYGDLKNNEVQKNAPLLIMHGFFGSKQNWKSLCRIVQPLMNPSRRIIAVDARNHGESPRSEVHTTAAMAADVKHLIETEKIKQVIFLGQSMGGIVGMHFAMQYPKLTERLIVVDTSPMPYVPGLKRHLELLKYIMKLDMHSDTTLLQARSQIEKVLLAEHFSPRVIQFLLQNIVKKPEGAISWEFNINPIKKYLENLISNSVIMDQQVTKLQKNFDDMIQFSVSIDSGYRYLGPTLFIKGGRSDYIQKADYRNIKAIFPEAEIEEVKKAGHWLHYEKQLDFLQLVLDFINDPEPPPDQRSMLDFTVS